VRRRFCLRASAAGGPPEHGSAPQTPAENGTCARPALPVGFFYQLRAGPRAARTVTGGTSTVPQAQAVVKRRTCGPERAARGHGRM
jgi:hypothetical protein